MKKSLKDDIDHFFGNDMYVPTRTIYMGSAQYSIENGESGVDGAMAERFIKALHILEADAPDGDKPITVIMNNPGGDFYHGVAIYDAIMACKNDVIIKVFGHAMSMGSLILQAADERIMAPNAKMMIHYGSPGVPVDGNSKTLYNWVDENKKMDKWMESVYLEKLQEKNPEFAKAEIKKMCQFDTFISAREAVNLGLADKILDDESEST
jgi:ATP-dependent Clp endopeptidase proteolytic subunit ClpP